MTLMEWSKESNGRNLFQVILDVKMTQEGSLERSMDDQVKDVRLLRKKLRGWFPTEKQFDKTVFELLRITVTDASNHLIGL